MKLRNKSSAALPMQTNIYSDEMRGETKGKLSAALL